MRLNGLLDLTLALGAIKTEWYAVSSLRVNHDVIALPMDEPRLNGMALSPLVCSFGITDVPQLLQKV